MRCAPVHRWLHPASPGFTLIELLAVLLIFGLLAAIAVPTLGLRGRRALRAEGERLAAALELARQRAIMTGRTHRVVLDLERSLHRVEWNAPRPKDATDRAPAPLDPALVGLFPPAEQEKEFVPLPGALGRDSPFEESVFFRAVELPEGPIRAGQVSIGFEPDGTAEPTTVQLHETDGGRRLALEVRRLADAVVIRDESP